MRNLIRFPGLSIEDIDRIASSIGEIKNGYINIITNKPADIWYCEKTQGDKQ